MARNQRNDFLHKLSTNLVKDYGGKIVLTEVKNIYHENPAIDRITKGTL